LEIVKTKGCSWQSAGHILAKTKNEEVLYTFMELLADNLFEKEADGSRSLSPPKGVSYGGNIAGFLGKMEDERAIPVLRNAVDQGDHIVRWDALEALYYLGDISMDQLFEMGISEGYSSAGHVILSIAFNNKYSNPELILSILNRFIDSFPEQKFEVSLAHMYKIDCYDYLGKYDEALQEADVAIKLFGPKASNSRLINESKQRIINKMIPVPADAWTYVDALEAEAEYKLDFDVILKAGEEKMTVGYTSFFKVCDDPENVSSTCIFPTKTADSLTTKQGEAFADFRSSYVVTSITENGVVVRVGFRCRSLRNGCSYDVDESVLIPFGGTGRCKKGDILYMWRWNNLKGVTR
jgi:tetratricopeptide (TPR) repeat protein